MTQRVVTVGMDDKLSVVNDVFQHCKFSHILVVEEGVLVGIVSDGDLFKSISHNIGSATESFTRKDAAARSRCKTPGPRDF